MMATDDQIQAAAQAFGAMTDEEARGWMAAGDYATVGGVPLPERATKMFAQLAAGNEVEGFGLDLNPLGLSALQTSEPDVAAKGSANLFQSCCKGEHLKEVVLHVT